MGSYKEFPGNLITLAKEGNFDFIGHGCNCWCTMGAGIAPHMAREFGCNDGSLYRLEGMRYKGDKRKLSRFEWNIFEQSEDIQFLVANIYSQYHFHRVGPDGIQLEYWALEQALIGIGQRLDETSNKSGKIIRVGLPRIGCGLAGGDWNRVSDLIRKHLDDQDVSIPIM